MRDLNQNKAAQPNEDSEMNQEDAKDNIEQNQPQQVEDIQEE